MTGEWPFPHENATIRARKMALAYRELARELRAEAEAVNTLIAKLDPRLLGWIEDPEIQGRLTDIHKAWRGPEPAQDAIAIMDERFEAWGEHWHTGTPVHYEPDDWVPGPVACKLIQLGPNSLRRARAEGKITADWRKMPGVGSSGWWYRVRDVYELRANMRGPRGWRTDGVKDTVGDNGRSDAE